MQDTGLSVHISILVYQKSCSHWSQDSYQSVYILVQCICPVIYSTTKLYIHSVTIVQYSGCEKSPKLFSAAETDIGTSQIAIKRKLAVEYAM